MLKSNFYSNTSHSSFNKGYVSTAKSEDYNGKRRHKG